MSEARRTPKLRFPEFIEEWEEKRLGDISTNIMYGIGSAAIKYDGVNKYLRITDIDDSSRNFVPKPLTSPEGLIHNNYKLSDGDIVFARTGASVGKSYLYKTSDGNLIFAGFLIKFNIISANPYFVYSNTFRHYYDNWVSVMSVRSGQPGINAEEYKLLPIGLPTKPEQQQIALFLTSVDSKIEQLSKKQELLREYKKGLMQKIFSQAIRFKADDGSDYPDWVEKKLGDVGKIVTGKTPSTSNLELWNGGIDFITPTDISGNKYQMNTNRTVTKQQNIKVLPKGSIVYTCIASIGKMSITVFDSITNQQINSLIVSDKYSNEFVYYYLLKITPYIKSTQASSTLPIINKYDFSRFEISLPSFEEQTKIANFLSSIDSKIEQIVKQLDETKQFKKALLQQMFV